MTPTNNTPQNGTAEVIKSKSNPLVTYALSAHKENNTTIEQLRRIAPYDETKYHSAQRMYNEELDQPASEWEIRRSGQLVATLAAETTPELVIEYCLSLDTQKGLERTGGIN